MKKYSIGSFTILEYEQATSTNTLAEQMPTSELTDRTVVLTWRQTHGRGQATNRWESAPGKNIAMTLILKPDTLSAGRQFAVSMAVALGCADFVGHYVKDVTVKWPNDIYVGDRKIAGILIEHRVAGAHIAASLCGVGLNVNQERFLSDAPNPVSLLQLTGHALSLPEALAELLACIDARCRFLHDFDALARDFRAAMYRGEGIFDWKDEHGVFRARIVGTDEYGQLVLCDTQGRERVYAFKEVSYVSVTQPF